MITGALWISLALVCAAVPALAWWWIGGREPVRGAHAAPDLGVTFPCMVPAARVAAGSPFRRWQEEHAVWLMDIRADVNRVAGELARGGWSDTPWIRA